MMAFLSSQRNIRDVLESTRIFNAIEIMCLRETKAFIEKNSFPRPCLRRRSGTVGGIFLHIFWSYLTQSPRRFCEMIPFLSSQRNIVDVLESTRILMQ